MVQRVRAYRCIRCYADGSRRVAHRCNNLCNASRVAQPNLVVTVVVHSLSQNFIIPVRRRQDRGAKPSSDREIARPESETGAVERVDSGCVDWFEARTESSGRVGWVGQHRIAACTEFVS